LSARLRARGQQRQEGERREIRHRERHVKEECVDERRVQIGYGEQARGTGSALRQRCAARRDIGYCPQHHVTCYVAVAICRRYCLRLLSFVATRRAFACRVITTAHVHRRHRYSHMRRNVLLSRYEQAFVVR